jgi:phosphoglycolate phosphatase
MALHGTNTRMNIFFDLDGTLIDSRRRLYRLFQHLIPASPLTFDDYWDLKRNKIHHLEILKNKFSFSKEAIERFDQKWLQSIEQAEWLALDKPFEGVLEYLNGLKLRHKLYLVTARQSENMALKQIAQYGWIGIFEKVLITLQKQEKYDLIKNSVETENTDWLVGDTGEDILTGKKLNLRTAAVLSGFRNEKNLESYKPDIIVNVVTDLKTHHYGE